jgi:two-component system, NtrC family, sensor kinase
MIADTKVNILMVDDQPAKLLSYEVILADLGENLIKANSASAALNILLKTDVAVVLMDVNMPDLDGFELAAVIRQHPRFQKTAIIFISGVHLTDSDKIHGYRSGAVDYISVPVVPEVLRAKVGVFVELYRKTRMLEHLNDELEQRVVERTELLKVSEDQFRTRAELLELASEAIMVREFKGGAIRFWNAGAEALYGWDRDEVLGQDIHSLLRTVFPISREALESQLREKGSWKGNLRQRTKEGAEIIVACRKTVNLEGDAVLEVNRDITAQIMAEDALRETEKLAAMGRVAGIIAHEINNPLAAITNLFYLIRNHPSLDEDARQIARLAEQELQRVSHITRQTLTFYRESKTPIAVSLTELLDDVVGLQERQLHHAHIDVEKRYFSSCAVHGFPVELRQIFLNLIGNAIQAMPNGGTMRLTVREGFDWISGRRGISVFVTDTGVGIKKQDARKLFEPFFSTKSTKGTGLGLWISKGIAQKYEGRIAFRSYCPGPESMTSFRVFFPSTGVFSVSTTSGSEAPIAAREIHTKGHATAAVQPV